MDIQSHPLEECEKEDRTNVVVSLKTFYSRINTYILMAGVLNTTLFGFCFFLLTSSAVSPLSILSLFLLGSLGSLLLFGILVKNKLVTAVISRSCTRYMQQGAYHV